MKDVIIRAEGQPPRAGRFSGQFSETQSDPNHASRKLVAFNEA